MKKYLFIAMTLLPIFAAQANVDCSNPRYANNPTLKKYCLTLDQSSTATIRSTEDKFSKDFSKYQLQMENPEQGQGNEAPNNNPQVPAPQTQIPAPVANDAPTESAAPPAPTPTPSGKPRRYY